MSKKPMYLDLDAVKPDVDVVIKLNGKEHRLVPASVSDFIQNTQKLQNLQTANKEGNMQEEIDLVIGILQKAFPSVSKEEFGALTLPQLNRFLEFAHENNGQAKVTEEVQKENPQKAG